MVQRGTNSWDGSGNVASDVYYGKTSAGDLACNFRLAVEQSHKQLSYFRVNVYGRNAEICEKRRLSKGDYVVIDGELMNRPGRDDVLTEIRCKEIVIHTRRREVNGNQ